MQALFRQKLELCCTMFDFDDPESDVSGKEMKRETLLELAEYVNSPSGQKIFTESLMPDIVKMVSTNLLRTLPPQTEDYDPEEDEPAMEVMWPHLQVVYEFFLRFIVSNEVNGKVAKRFVDQNFIKRWIELFDAEDPRERDYVKTVLHRMYGKFMSYRASIRKIISQVFFRFIYETGRYVFTIVHHSLLLSVHFHSSMFEIHLCFFFRHNGIAELLEILHSIEERTHSILGAGIDSIAQTSGSRCVPPTIVVLCLTVRGKRSRDHCTHRTRPCALLALEQRCETSVVFK